jgi:hypothetical protein
MCMFKIGVHPYVTNPSSFFELANFLSAFGIEHGL